MQTLHQRLQREISIHVGTARVVFVLHRLGYALKFPRVRPIAAVWDILSWAEASVKKSDGQWDFFKERMLSTKIDIGSPYLLIIRGFCENIYESKTYRNNKNELHWPITFSFFGLVIIQPVATNHPTRTALREYIDSDVAIIDEVEQKNIHHEFRESRNFTVASDGRLCLLDYGSKGVVKFIENSGSKFSLGWRKQNQIQ